MVDINENCWLKPGSESLLEVSESEASAGKSGVGAGGSKIAAAAAESARTSGT